MWITQPWLVLALHLIGWEISRSFPQHLQSVVKQDQCSPNFLSNHTQVSFVIIWKVERKPRICHINENSIIILINNSLDFNRIHGLPVALCFLQPSLVRDLINCLKGVHQSQSVYLIKILAEYFLNSTHQSVARMAECLICKKLEICIDGQKMVNHAFYSVQSLKTLCSKVLASKNIWATKNSSYIKLKCSPLQLACI